MFPTPYSILLTLTLRFLPALVGLGPAGGEGAAFGDLDQANAAGKGRALGVEAVLAQQVAQAQLDRVHVQGLGELGYLHFGGKEGLGCAKAAKGAAGRVVGVGAVDVCPDVGDVIGADAGGKRVAQHLVGGIAVGSAVGQNAHLGSDQLAVARGAPLVVQPHGVALVVASDRFSPRPDDLDRTADAAPSCGAPSCGVLIEAPDGQGEDDLHRHVFAAAKSAADGRIDDPHPLRGKVQGVGDLVLVLVRPLPADDDRDSVLVIDVRQTCFWLKVGVFLGAGLVIGFHDHVRLRPGGRYIAFANLMMGDEVPLGAQLGMHRVGLPVGMELRRVGLQGREWIGDDGQVLVFDADQVPGLLCCALAFGHDHGHLVADKAHHVGSRLGRSGTAQHRLVGRLQAILVDRYVARSEHGHHAGQGFGLSRVDAQDPGMGPPGKEELGVEHVVHCYVTGIERLAGDLGAGVHAGDRLANSACHWFSLHLCLLSSLLFLPDHLPIYMFYV